MEVTINDIRKWLNSFDKEKYSHVMIVCDTYDYDNFPVYFSSPGPFPAAHRT